MRRIKLVINGLFAEVQQLKMLLEASPSGAKGYTIGDVRAAIKIIDKLDKLQEEGGRLALEEAEWSWLCKRIAEQEWAVARPEIIALVDKIEGAPSVEAV